MPFVCKFQLNNGAIKATDKVQFLEFIDASFGDFHSTEVKIARVLFNDRIAFVYSTCPCFPSGKGPLVYGELLTDKTEIGYFSANGEDIPYNKPYAIIKST